MGKRHTSDEHESSKKVKKEHKSSKEKNLVDKESYERTLAENLKVTIEGSGSDNITPLSKFHDAPFDSKLIDFCSKFPSPSPIQSNSWPFLAKNRDVIGIAETGSGKTVAFGIPSINKIICGNSIKNYVYILVIAPTRELCIQTFTVLEEIGNLVGLRSACIYGGMPKEDQRKQLRRHPNIIVATPGRLNDFIDSSEISLSKLDTLVLDEADRMLDLGFEPEIRKIISSTPSSRQTLMFSATWPQSIQKLASEFLKNPVKITIGRSELSANLRIKQSVEVVDSKDKDSKLKDLLQKIYTNNQKIIIFVLYKVEASRVEQNLIRGGYKAVSIHGDKSQSARNEAFETFKSGKVSLLVATDVAARGLDIPNVEYVVNYTFPLTIEDYIHRIGRTGRGGKSGSALTFFTSNDKAHSGELVNVLKRANQIVPEDLVKFGTTVKKKEHKEYGAFFKDIDHNAKGAHQKFDSDSE